MTREEAIEIIKRNCTNGSLMHEACEILLPELFESEDERIRKDIVTYLTNELNNVEQLTPRTNEFERWLSWFEKQKEPKPAEWSDDFGKEVENVHKRYPEVSFAKLTRIAYHFSKWASRYKGIEWSEEDEHRLSDVIYFLENAKSHYADTDEFEKTIAWLKSFKPQPKQEWSEDYREEDLRTRFAFYTYKNEEDDLTLYLSNVFVEEASRNKGFGTKILAAAEKVAETLGMISIRLKVKQDSPANTWYRKHGYGYIAFEDGYDWLEKNLEYMKPNKQEWSEEDERNFYWISTTLQERHMTL